jgi:hypothetical protein
LVVLSFVFTFFPAPTNFAPIIRRSIKLAKDVGDGLKYFILLLITDGEISDMIDTIAAVVEASYHPMSIIIVGVGSADFSNMNKLDADTEPLQANGRYAMRDITQVGFPTSCWLRNGEG